MSQLLVIELVSGTPVMIHDEMGCEIRGMWSGQVIPLRIDQVQECLSYPEGWIEYDTKIKFVSDEAREAWQLSDDDEDDQKYPTVARIYARGVASVAVAEVS